MFRIMNTNYIKKIIFPDTYEEDIINEFEDIKNMLHKSKYNYNYYIENEKTIDCKIITLRYSIDSNDKLYIMFNIIRDENDYIKKTIEKYKNNM